MRFIFILITLTFLFPGWSGEEKTEPEQAPLPAAVIRALDTYDAEVDRAQVVYRKAVEKARAKALTAIDKEQTNVTKKGDLEMALAIKAKATELTKHNPGGLTEIDILGNKMKTKPINTIEITPEKWMNIKSPSLTILGTNTQKDPVSMVIPPGEYQIIAHPTDSWTGGGSMGRNTCGIDGWKGGQWMKLHIKTSEIDSPVTSFTLTKKETVLFYAWDTDTDGNNGKIRIKFYKINK